MVDRVSVATRSRMMSVIRSKDTRPEMCIRRLLHARGLRFQLHRNDLPGSPDIVLVRFGAVIFVHGCFWHQHTCAKSAIPQSRTEWWTDKLSANRRRDRESRRRLRSLDWRVLTIWECALRKADASGRTEALADRIEAFLQSDNSALQIPR